MDEIKETSEEYFARVNKQSEDWATNSIHALIDNIPELKNLKYSQVEYIERKINQAYYCGYTQGKENL